MRAKPNEPPINPDVLGDYVRAVAARAGLLPEPADVAPVRTELSPAQREALKGLI